MVDPLPAASPPPPPPSPPQVTIDEFRRMDLRVAKVLEAQDHPNAQRLLVLKVDIGGETRQLVAGIKKNYEAASLVGKHVITICNVQPAMLRGVESQGMVLAASAGEQVVVLTPDKEVPAGSKVS